MSVQLAEEIVGLDEASAELDRMIASEQSTPEQRAAQAEPVANAAGDAGNDDQAGKETAGTATPGEKDAQGKPSTTAVTAPDGAKTNSDKSKPAAPAANAADAAADKGKSRYAKAQERLQGGWEELNTSKAAIKAEQEAWQKQRDAEKAELQRQREEFEQQRSKAEGEFTADQYEAVAKKFDAEGKLELADLARARAEQLRKNPPRPAAAANEEDRKAWALKAGKDFPDLARDKSPLQQRVAQLLNEEAEFKSHPKGIYVAARIANLEAQAAESQALKETVAARDKELTALKARVTELEAITAPGGGNGRTALPGAKTFEQMDSNEQLQQLEREAREMGVLGR